MFSLRFTTFIACLMLVAGCGYLPRYAASTLFYESGEEFNVTPEEKGMNYVAVEFENTDRNNLRGWVIPGKDGFPSILYFY